MLFTQMTRRDTDGGPQADDVGEQVLITDERLMIIRKLIKLRKFLIADYSHMFRLNENRTKLVCVMSSVRKVG